MAVDIHPRRMQLLQQVRGIVIARRTLTQIVVRRKDISAPGDRINVDDSPLVELSEQARRTSGAVAGVCWLTAADKGSIITKSPNGSFGTVAAEPVFSTDVWTLDDGY